MRRHLVECPFKMCTLSTLRVQVNEIWNVQALAHQDGLLALAGRVCCAGTCDSAPCCLINSLPSMAAPQCRKSQEPVHLFPRLCDIRDAKTEVLGYGGAQTAVLHFQSNKMKVTVKTVKGAAQSYEVEPELKVTMQLASSTTKSLPWDASPRRDSGSRFVRSSDPRLDMQVLDFKKQIEEKQGADYPAASQKVIFKGSVGIGAMHTAAVHVVLLRRSTGCFAMFTCSG